MADNQVDNKTAKHMKKNYKIPGLFLLLLFCYSGYGQSITEEFEKMRVAYSKNTNYSCNIKYAYYEGHTATAPQMVVKGEYKRDGMKSYSSMGGSEVISNHDYVLVVNHTEKEITYLPKASYGTMNKGLDTSMDSLLSVYKKVSRTKIDANREAYDLEMPEGGIYSKIRIVFNKTVNMAEKLSIYYNIPATDTKEIVPASKLPRLDITYTDYVFQVTYPADTFTYDKFLVKQGMKKYACTSAYKYYRIN
jgi:outer membrane lipoprotein-sorting protein